MQALLLDLPFNFRGDVSLGRRFFTWAEINSYYGVQGEGRPISMRVD